MLAKDIATEFRTEIDDTDTADPLWSDTEVIRYMNLAVEEVAEKTLCINEATASLTELTVTAASEWVPYNEVILEFDPQQAYSQGQARNLPIMNKYEFLRERREDDYGKATPAQDWQSVSGTPKLFISDLRVESLRAYPIPVANDTLEVFVKRLPLASEEITDISSTSVEVPVIPAMFHRKLVVYMMHRAYLKNDAECYDRGLANTWLSMWEGETLKEMKRKLKRRQNRKASVARYRPHG
jgi:hypothetical protein